jgi:hypothetical protein
MDKLIIIHATITALFQMANSLILKIICVYKLAITTIFMTPLLIFIAENALLLVQKTNIHMLIHILVDAKPDAH